MNILWDFDGTLFDTYPAYTKILHQVLNGKVDEKEIYARLKVSFSHAADFFNLTEEQLNKVGQLVIDLEPSDIKPFDKVEEVLKFVDKNVIMTHKDRDGVLKILNYYGWNSYFIDMVTKDDGYPRKPNSASYKYLHENHKIDLAIGDREIDLIPAKELGIKTCIFQNENVDADYSISSYSELLKLLK
ncbi:HAD-IA family hydrolase [Bacillus sp. FJAT-49736]|uniref:HAD-IA family hydrolase n=1 Tax=Bacillus sp. FJAT-49736 TaxID=2833582 RepID=UPI001BC986D7|nr:HAD-IA family hydrolase [Bacillus sp. FJAT-49736]MBS4172749.1 HAD-IA family hydrolase [Bacillus sp. FJAT-49736]